MTVTMEEIEEGLTHANIDTRFGWVRRMDFTPTPEQIERGLTDVDEWIRAAWAERMDWTPTPEQIEKGQSDKAKEVRYYWARRMDFTPIPAQIERGLTDENKWVRLAWAERADCDIPHELVESLLKDDFEDVVAVCIKRVHMEWTDTQIQEGLLHPQKAIREAWVYVAQSRKDQSITFSEDIFSPSI